MSLEERTRAALQRGIGLDTKAVIRDQAREIERLRAALKPFAECVDDHTMFCGNPEAAEVEIGYWANLRFNDFVRAREAFNHEQSDGK